MNRCKWPNLEQSDVYKKYHDEEWGVASHDDSYLFEMLLLESFHCGLSWLIILKKREYFKEAFDDYDYHKIANYDENKVKELMNNSNIVRNEQKIRATIKNAQAFIKVQQEYTSFNNYLYSFTNNEVIYLPSDNPITRNELSDKISKDLKKRGFSFMGSVTTFSYLEAIGLMNNHATYCFRYKQ